MAVRYNVVQPFYFGVDMYLEELRPWGNYLVLEEGTDYKVKRLTVHPGEQLSVQSHQHREEHWVVVKGTAQILRGAEHQVLQIGDSIKIPKGWTHRITNPTNHELVIIETQIGNYLGEDDIVRHEDKYGRS